MTEEEMETPKQILDRIIIGMPDSDKMKECIIMAMVEYAESYHQDKLKKLGVAGVSYCECTDRTDNWYDDNSRNWCFDCEKEIIDSCC